MFEVMGSMGALLKRTTLGGSGGSRDGTSVGERSPAFQSRSRQTLYRVDQKAAEVYYLKL